MRKETMENSTNTEKIAGRRNRSQQRMTPVTFLCHLLNITTFQLLQSVEDLVLWRSMVAYVLKRLDPRKKKKKEETLNLHGATQTDFFNLDHAYMPRQPFLSVSQVLIPLNAFLTFFFMSVSLFGFQLKKNFLNHIVQVT
ncbi:hypothetical protein HELRODRAFT_167421 [Helobdella robusta]|uniref:Uncharacterized protein n=1 Tax=Helobdella robusta TaxID=6412 RepID=T1EZC5_HELRO|nr:hypothetical protein HELRODRAFT_167421 [Helobdella robusta]ESO10909.1 hypothetical protein HELRODRAFT_167421 [Helobdella robusta]